MGEPPCAHGRRPPRWAAARGRIGLGHFVRARLHRRIFVWFGATILLTLVTVSVVTWGAGGPTSWRRDVDGAKAFLGGRFERVWDDPAAREELAGAVARDLSTDVTLVDADRRVLASVGPPCDRPAITTPVTRAGKELGAVRVCTERQRPRSPFRLILPLFIAGATIWLATGKIARRLARPMSELARVAQDIGAGRLSSRVELGRHVPDEAGLLADAINDMAARIERQMADQRELLAAVSHEIRTPLARIRLLAEIARDRGGPDAKTLDEIDREVVEIDALVGELLASSRLEFAALSPSRVDAAEAAGRALERAGLGPDVLALEAPEGAAVEADPTLLARALANLLDNAKKHAGGAERLRVAAREDGAVAFEVEDRGPGLEPGDEAKIFDPFYGRPSGEAREHGSLGLGLALVKRIAEAHGGKVYAASREGGGARIGFELPASPVPT